MTTFTDDPLRRDGFARIYLEGGKQFDVALPDGQLILTNMSASNCLAFQIVKTVYGGTLGVTLARVRCVELWPPPAQAARQAELDAAKAEEKPSWMD